MILFLMLLPVGAYAQADRIKALKDSVRVVTNDSLRWRYKVGLAEAIFKTDTAKGNEAFRQLAASSEFKNTPWKQFVYYQFLDVVYFDSGDYIQQILVLETMESAKFYPCGA
ncbi:MAG: hypothetical protein R2822_30655 [Spirosomataceae bacterium]